MSGEAGQLSTETGAERDAFVATVVYHYRRASDACSCGPLPLGSSFADHLWDVFDALRQGRVLAPVQPTPGAQGGGEVAR